MRWAFHIKTQNLTWGLWLHRLDTKFRHKKKKKKRKLSPPKTQHIEKERADLLTEVMSSTKSSPARPNYNHLLLLLLLDSIDMGLQIICPTAKPTCVLTGEARRYPPTAQHLYLLSNGFQLLFINKENKTRKIKEER